MNFDKSGITIYFYAEYNESLGPAVLFLSTCYFILLGYYLGKVEDVLSPKKPRLIQKQNLGQCALSSDTLSKVRTFTCQILILNGKNNFAKIVNGLLVLKLLLLSNGDLIFS